MTMAMSRLMRMVFALVHALIYGLLYARNMNHAKAYSFLPKPEAEGGLQGALMVFLLLGINA